MPVLKLVFKTSNSKSLKEFPGVFKVLFRRVFKITQAGPQVHGQAVPVHITDNFEKEVLRKSLETEFWGGNPLPIA